MKLSQTFIIVDGHEHPILLVEATHHKTFRINLSCATWLFSPNIFVNNLFGKNCYAFAILTLLKTRFKIINYMQKAYSETLYEM